MAKPPMPLSAAEEIQEMNTHEVEFVNKVAPYNSGETAWFPLHRAAAMCIQGVAKPLRVKHGGTGEILGMWELSANQNVVAQQIQAARITNAGDYAELVKGEEASRKEEEARVDQGDANKAELAESGSFSENAKPAGADVAAAADVVAREATVVKKTPKKAKPK